MRRSRNNFNKINWKKYLKIFLILVVVLVSIVFVINKHKSKIMDKDFKLGIVSENELQLISISLDRKMINVLKVKPEVPMWLPNGLGWYRVNQIEKIISEKKSPKLISDIFWYNFGFTPNKILIKTLGEENYKNDWMLLTNMGLGNFLNYKINSSQMLYKEEIISTDILANNEFLDEIIPRDFADNKVLGEDLKISVYNATTETGLADFVSERLEWAGMSVISTDNSNQITGKCLLIYGPKVDLSLGWQVLTKNFDCKREFNQNLNEDEAELYLGEEFVSMIKYSSYKRSI